MSHPFKTLSDEQWTALQELVELKLPLQRGIQRTDLRKIWNSIFYILSRGCRWIELPQTEFYAARPTAHRWFMRWQREGVFDRVMSRLLQRAHEEGKIDISHVIVDGTFSLGSRGRRGGGIWAQRKGRADTSIS